MKIGFIGLGVMGHSMAGHLLEKFGDLVVWNRTTSKAADLKKKGAAVADSPADLANRVDVICLCVADTPDVENVVFGEKGVFDCLNKGKLIIDFSTISAEETERFSARVGEMGARWIDAPISGGDVGARNATLTIMTGGEKKDFEMALPLFQAVGKKIHHMGPVGFGQRTKMANQIAVAGTLASMGEAMAFAQQSGMDIDKVIEVLGSGAAGSWSLSNYGPRVARGDLDPGFAISLMAKDLRLVAELLEGMPGDFTTVKHLTEIFNKMNQQGDGNKGCHACAVEMGWKV